MSFTISLLEILKFVFKHHHVNSQLVFQTTGSRHCALEI